MVVNTRENLCQIKDMVTENSNGKMEDSIEVSGLMASNMAREYSSRMQKIRRDMGNGKKVKELDGLNKENNEY
jgi:hypothetical protein